MTTSTPRPPGGETLLQTLSAMTGFYLLGRSGQGRPILGKRFSSPIGPSAGHDRPADRPAPENRGALLLVGGVHGDEPSSVEALLELATRLPLSASTPGPPVIIVPALNPDGLVAGSKNTASDVDLNRNFPARNFTRLHAPGYDPGPAPLSEPETALLATLIDSEAVGAVVAVHAPFACVNFDGPAREWADAVAAACGWPVRENIGYPTPGSLGSWLGVDRNLPVLTLELPPGPLHAFRSAAAAALDRACGEISFKIATSAVNLTEIG